MAIVDPSPVTREYGRFGFQPVAGFVHHDPAAAFSGRLVMGVPIQAQYLYGSFRAIDGRGYHAPIRHFHNDVAISLFLYVSQLGEDFTYLRESARAHRGIVDTGERDGMWGFWRAEEDPRCLFLADEASARWFERGIVDVTGEVRGDAMQFAIPDAESPLVYTSRCFKTEVGTVNGDRVAGYFFHDTQHMGFGQGWTSGAYFREQEGTWVAFVTEFADGNVHMGHLIWGLDNFALGLVQRSDGDPIVATGIGVEHELDDDGYATRVAFHLDDDEVWEWTTIGGARMPRSPLPGGPHWVEGVVRRRGDDRPWVHSDAWMETYNDRLQKAPSPS